MSDLGSRLRSARERKGLKQTQVKDRTGINNKTLSGYENGVSEPDTDTLMKLAEIYEVSTDWLIGKKNESYSLSESSFDRIIKETESHYKVNLHDDPVVLAAMKSLIESIAQAKSKQ
ncbi:helix-turn-helix domain-containing protein [Cohnella sp. GCM10012308]|uniref:helix-turn-helix domain-containing protein n=1 Tax=Cohnella sp. GCM10012308 TaxID=3317329 RepID=UPI00360D1B59